MSTYHIFHALCIVTDLITPNKRQLSAVMPRYSVTRICNISEMKISDLLPVE